MSTFPFSPFSTVLLPADPSVEGTGLAVRAGDLESEDLILPLSHLCNFWASYLPLFVFSFPSFVKF